MRAGITSIGQSENSITCPPWATCKLEGFVPERVVLMNPGSRGVDRDARKASVAPSCTCGMAPAPT